MKRGDHGMTVGGFPEVRPKTLALIVAAVALILLFFGLTGLSRLLQQETQIAASLESNGQGAVRFDLPAMNLQLQEVQAQTNEERSFFPEAVRSSAIAERILELARNAQVEVTDLSVKPAAAEKIGSGSYLRVPAKVEIRGEPARLRSFLGALETNTFKTLVVDKFTADFSGPQAAAIIDVAMYLRAAPVAKP